MTDGDKPYIHPQAEVSPAAIIGSRTFIWFGAQVRENARIGSDCRIGKGAYVDADVHVGNCCKIENNASIFSGATLEDGVFVGPHAVLTNDRLPRAITPDGRLKSAADWKIGPIMLRYGCSIGAGAIVLPEVEIGRFALIGAGAVVTRSVPSHALILGNPGRLVGYVCACGGRLEERDLQDADRQNSGSVWVCRVCGRHTEL